MKMRQPAPESLWQKLSTAGNLADRWLCGADSILPLEVLAGGSSLGGRLDELRGRSVLVAIKDQLPASLALIELDGVARRMVLCPPDLPPEYVPSIIATASVDAVVCDPLGAEPGAENVECVVTCTPTPAPGAPDRRASEQTEWILLTSGTTGVPKLVVHDLDSLTAAITGRGALGARAVWSTFYDIRRYGGLQIFLRAMLGGGSMVLSRAHEPVADFLVRAGTHGVTHISGTPSHWRRALMSPSARRMAPRYVRLSGEIADQAILDHLRAVYPQADVAHAFASTEAGVAFDVGDGLAGFPASLIDEPRSGVEMRVEDGSLRIKSSRIAHRYLGGQAEPVQDADGFVDTGDMVELRDGRYYFVGRRGGIINIGGLKVHPEEVEAVINRHPGVRMSLVKARKSPITGAIVVADVVVDATTGAPDAEGLRSEILGACRQVLPRHKVPTVIRFVDALDVSASGKLARPHA
jgi:acyl-coenzyme A synthetase/AMP-(fatty) acid ligase